MDYYLLKYDTKIKELEQKKEYTVDIIKKISDNEDVERKYYQLLIRHTKKLDKYDNEIDMLQDKYFLYKNLFEDLDEMIDDEIKENEKIDNEDN